MRPSRPGMRIARSLCRGAALFGALAAARDAGAFCRTTSVPVAIGYDPAEVGACWTTGDAGTAVDLAWPARSRVPYSLVSNASTQVTLAAATAAAHLAFEAWAGAQDSGAGSLCASGPPN